MKKLQTLSLMAAAGLAGSLMVPILVGADFKASHSDAYQPAFEPVRVLDTRATGIRLTGGVPVVIEIPAVAHTSVTGSFETSWATPALAVAVNLTVVEPDHAGYLTAWGSGPQPAVSNVNFGAGEIEANFAIVPVQDGTIQLVASTDTDVVVDLFGQFDEIVPAPLP